MIQIAAQRLIIVAVNAYAGAEFKELCLVYEVFTQKLQYMLQISSQGGQPLCIIVLKTVLSKISELNDGKECPTPGIIMSDDVLPLDPMELSGIISQALRMANGSDVLMAWTEFLQCSPNYFVDALGKLMEPQCQTLARRIHEEMNPPEGLRDEIITEDCTLVSLISSAVDIICAALDTGSSVVKGLLPRPSMVQVLKPAITREGSFDKGGAGLLRINPVTTVIPVIFVEIGTLISRLSPENGHIREIIFRYCRKMYQASPLTTMYTLMEYLGNRLEVGSETGFLLKSPIELLLSPSSGPFGCELFKTLGSCLKYTRDSRNDAFSKLYLMVPHLIC
jgi:hypothetical protein